MSASSLSREVESFNRRPLWRLLILSFTLGVACTRLAEALWRI